MRARNAFCCALALLGAGCDPVLGHVAPPTIVGTRAFVQPTGCAGLRAVDLPSGSVEALPFGGSWALSPAAAGHDVYTVAPASDHATAVVAHDVDQHKDHWRTELPGWFEGMRVVGTGVAVTTRVGFDSRLSRLSMLDTKTGAIRWSTPASGVLDVRADNLVFVDTDSAIEARDAVTGALLQTMKNREGAQSSEAIAVLKTTVYAVHRKSQLFSDAYSLGARDLGSGAEIGSVPLAVLHGRGVIHGAMPLDDELVVFTSFGLFAADPAAHKVLWTASCTGDGDARDDLVACATDDDTVSAWGAATGRLAWQTTLPLHDFVGPVIGGGSVIVVDDHRLGAIDQTTGRLRFVADLCKSQNPVVASR